jgi:predicted RNA methylase
MKKTEKQKFIKKSEFDQFYTKPEVASHCINIIEKLVPKRNRKVMIEPSAGTGAFIPSKKIYESLYCFDIDPKDNKITKLDFLNDEFDIGGVSPEFVTVFGNPPFGRVCSLAIKFINKSAELADTVAFILPKTFKKYSIQNRVNPEFFLIYSEDLPKKCFIFDGSEYDVPCVFQIWGKKHGRVREKQISHVENELFYFCPKDEADFAIIRVGGRAGTLVKKTDFSPSSVYFVKLKPGISYEKTIDVLTACDFSISKDTAGVKSLSKNELNQCIEEVHLTKEDTL